jgi:glyoxylase I family protein
MKIEHVAFNIRDPVAAAEWYVKHLGMRVVRKSGEPTYTHFLADAAGRAVVEIYNNPKAAVPDYPATDSLVLHLAFAVDDIHGARERLLRAGATAEGEIARTPTGDEIAMVRDPWGFAIQLVKRAVPLVG